MSPQQQYDVIIIGGGPAGLTAAIYTAREGFSTLLLEKGICGGWVTATDLIENYPGFPDGINGMELAANFKKQAQKFGARVIEIKEVKGIRPSKDNITVITDKEEYNCRAAILATGTMPRKLGIPGEAEFTGKGVSYCATCDGPLFKDKTVAVIGGGNAAAEEALFLTKFAKKVILIHRRFELRASDIFQKQLKENSKIELLLNHVPIAINGDKKIYSIIAEEKDNKKQTKLDIDGVFIYIGFLPNSQFLQGLLELDESGYIKTNEAMQASHPGIFAAGDIRSKGVYQVATAVGDGTIAALSVRDYLK
ncbi:MAG: thioredoxin-disulfide reductase [Candidatus Omnitrophota bacterium]